MATKTTKWINIEAGNDLTFWQNKLGISDAQLAAELQVSQNSVRNWRLQKAYPLRRMVALAIEAILNDRVRKEQKPKRAIRPSAGG